MGERKGEGNLPEGYVSLSNAREDDMISKLPDSLISNLLLYLPTKLAVRTSVLSNRWKRLWLLIPELDLDSSEFPDYTAFVTFMEKFLNFSREQKSCLHKLKLSIQKDENGQSFLKPWIDFAATPKLQHLDVQYLRMKPECFEVIPTMHLEYNVYANEASLELLISSCPVLEDLGIVRRRVGDNVRVLRVHSNTITSLIIETGEPDDENDDEYDFGENSEVIIDAPRLKYLDFDNELSASKTISNSGSLANVNILDDFYVKNTVIRKFLTSISGVRSMKIDWIPFEFLENNAMPLPQFCNLSCLEVELYFSSVEVLPKFLESFPNLRSLVLDLLCSSGNEQTRLSFVPQCMLSSLEFVEIKREIFFDGPSKMKMKVAKYFAENSVILKKLVLNVKSLMPEEKTVVIRCLTAKLRRDSTCQIIVP